MLSYVHDTIDKMSREDKGFLADSDSRSMAVA